MKLYELTEQYIGLSHLIDEGELDAEALQDTLDGLEGDLQAKAEGLLSYVANIGSDVSAIDTEIKRLQARKKVMTNRQDSLREYLRFNMVQGDIKKISCPLFTISLRKPVDVVEIDGSIPTELLPKEYLNWSVSINKMKIKSDLKAGKDVPGARLVPGKPGLMIK